MAGESLLWAFDLIGAISDHGRATRALKCPRCGKFASDLRLYSPGWGLDGPQIEEACTRCVPAGGAS